MTRLDDLQPLRDAVAAQKELAGLHSCQYALALDGEVVYTETLGADDSARFMMMSATKALLPAVVWQLVGEGALAVDLPVTTWWPEFGGHGKDAVTLEQLMVHTAGLPSATVSDAGLLDREARVREMEAWPLESAPGTQYAYHGLSAHWVMAELVARATGKDHRVALRERVLDPLGLDRLELGVPVERQHDLQPIVRVGSPPSLPDIEELLGIPVSQLPPTPAVPAGGADLLDLLARPEALAAGVPGAGGVSDAASVALFYQHLLHDAKGLWDPAVLHDATRHVRNRLPDMLGRAAFRTLGLEVAGDDEKAGLRLGAGATSSAAFGHGGAGGQVAWVDPATGLSFAFLTASIDTDFVRMYRRDIALTKLAAQVVQP